ncbi:DUF2283 domain-containing protein [bacterium]|nr:DUF2283 domain-containing protein [bacterium]
MRITYDSDVHALYIRFIETTVTTKHVAEGIAIDYSEDGRIAGIEVLDASERFGDSKTFRKVVLENNGAVYIDGKDNQIDKTNQAA